MTRIYANWQAFVGQALSKPHIFVFDGQLFHGDLPACYSWRAHPNNYINMCTPCCK